MIRFSAALVAVAIGVLIAGIAASKLLLVYVAIAVSAVALVALAIGVVLMLKRGELFGEGQGLAPAQAGASPVLPARAGDSDYQSRPNGQVTPPPAPGAAVGPGAAFARHGQAAFSQSGRAQSGGTWEAQAGRGSWPSPATAAPPPSGWQAPATSGATAGGWGAQAVGEGKATGNPQAAGDTVQGGSTAPRTIGPLSSGPLSSDPLSSDTVPPSAFAPRPVGRPPAAPGAGPGSAPPGWFDSSDKGASAEPPATAPTPAPGAGGGWSWLNTDAGDASDTVVPGDEGKPEGAVVDEDDDWPTRYSWLEDEPEANAGTTDDRWAANEPAAVAEAAAESDSVVSAGVPAAAAATHEAGAPATGEVAADTEVDAPEAPGSPANQPTATGAGDGGHLVTVVRGVPRFHQEDCILIRFMPEGDTQKVSVAQAREAGCTPCTACEPEG